MMVCGIYALINTANGKLYIGQSTRLYDRIKEHLNSLKKGKHYNQHLQSSWDKYGADVFATCMLEECTPEKLNAREVYWIKITKSFNPKRGYNLESGGNSNYKVSEETREKMRNAQKGPKHPMWGVKGKDNPRYGIKVSEETKRKLRENHPDLSGKNNPMYGKRGELSPNFGKKHSLDTLKKISESRNSTGYFRVYKAKSKSCKQGFWYVYRYSENGKRKTIGSIDIKKLEKKVLELGLEWFKLS